MQPRMRRRIGVAVLATCALGLVSVTAFGSLKQTTWRAYGDQFRLGYVTGYLEAVVLSQRKDRRIALPAGRGRQDYDRWLREIDAYFADPANARRTVPDAMAAVGDKIRRAWLENWAAKQANRAKPSPSPSPGP